MRKVLVTAISGNVANGILKAISETDDMLYGCDVYKYPAGMDRVSQYWKSDFAVHENYLDNLLEQCVRHGITHLIPVNEQEIMRISENIALFEEKNIKVIINKRRILNSFMDKLETYKALKKIDGIDVPETYPYKEFQEDGRKYMVKLRKSCGSKFLKVIRSKAEIDKYNMDEEEYIIQEFLENENEEYTIGCYSNGIKTETITFKRKLEHGYTSFVELEQKKEFELLGAKIASQIGLEGSINIQLRKDGDKYKIFEINPRISGTVFFRHMLGFQDVLWWLNMVDGKTEYCYERKYHKAIGLRELSEKFLVLE